MKLKLFGMAILFSALTMSCKDELSDSIDRDLRETETKVEKVTPTKSSSSEERKRRDRDWETSTAS